MSLSNNPRQKYLRDNWLKVPCIEYMSIKHEQAFSPSFFPPLRPPLFSIVLVRDTRLTYVTKITYIRGYRKENEVVGYAYLTIRLNETLSVVS